MRSFSLLVSFPITQKKIFLYMFWWRYGVFRWTLPVPPYSVLFRGSATIFQDLIDYHFLFLQSVFLNLLVLHINFVWMISVFLSICTTCARCARHAVNHHCLWLSMLTEHQWLFVNSNNSEGYRCSKAYLTESLFRHCFGISGDSCSLRRIVEEYTVV